MSMSRCLAKLQRELRDFDTRGVKSAAEKYRSRGKEDQAANIAAVEDHLRDLRQQKRAIEQKVLDAWKERDPEGYAKAARPALDLKGETEAEIRTREAKQAKEAEDAKKRENAPSEKGFTLTGSDRNVDVAEAHGQKPMFRRSGAAVTEHISAEDAKALWKNLTAGFKNLPPAHFLASPKQAPADLLSQIKKAGAESTIMGAYHEGEVYVFADNIPDLESMERFVASHELRHYGMEGRYGRDLRSALLSLRSLNPELKAEADAKKAEFPDLDDSSAVNEALADKPLDYAQKLKGWKRLVLTMRAWLNAHGYTRLAKLFDGVKVSPDEITRDFLYDVEQYYKGPPPKGAAQFYGTQFHRAYHGSPHDFEEFSLHAIGSGEGAAAYGWGLYFASERAVADYYRRSLSDSSAHQRVFMKNGEELPENSPERHAASLLYFNDLREMRALSKRWLKEAQAGDNAGTNDVAHKAGLTPVEYWGRLNDFMQAHTRRDVDVRKGRLYEVELAPKEEDYLDLDKPLSAQNDAVKAIVRDMIREDGYLKPSDNGPRQLLSAFEEWRMAHGGFGGGNKGAVIYDALTKRLGGAKQASEFLASKGIPGLRYLDGDSRAKGSGKHNFVIFDPKFVKVTAKFSRRSQPDWIEKGSDDLKAAASKIDTFAPGESMKDKLQALKATWKERVVQGVFDAYAPLKRLGNTEYVKARMVKSTDGPLEGLLLYGKPVMGDDGVIHGDIDRKGFLGAMKELQGEHDRFFMWVAGNRAERLMNEDREHLFTADEIRAMKGLVAGKMPNGTSRPAAYAKAATALREYNKAVLDIAEKTGLIDGESRHIWEHDFYVPFFRVDEDAKIEGPGTKVKGLVRQQAFKKLKGGTENLGDLMANTLRNWSHLLSASMANQAAVASLKAAEKVGIAREVPAETQGATYAMVDGQKTYYEVDDPFILTAISAMESASFKGLPMKVMGKFKHYLTLGVTVSPTFRVRNLIRDSLSAVGQNDMSYNVMKNLAQGFAGTSRKSDTYAQMLFNGAMMRFGQLTDGKHAEHAKRLIEAGVEDSTILTNPEKVKAAITKWWDDYQEFGDRMENVNRAALYKQMKAEGKSDLEAAFAARDMMDFSLQGSWVGVRFLTQIVPFMNARLQGLYKLGRAGAENPARLGYVSGAVALASIALLLAYKDDDEWKKREDWDRDTYWWFRIGDKAYRIPKPFEIGAIGTLAERSAELMLSDEMTGKRFGERMMYMLGQTFAMNPIPQFFKPAIDLYANQDSFTGRQIESRGMENLSKPERATANTSLVAKILGRAGDKTQLSPAQIDFLIRGYFGWLGTHVAMTVDIAASPFMAEKPARKVDDYFIVGDFVKGLPSSQSRYVEQFYKETKAIHEVMGDIHQARDVRDVEKAKQIMTEHHADVALSHLYSSAERRMTAINREIRRVNAAADKTAEQKRDELDRLNAMRNELARIVDVQTRAARRAPAGP